MVSITDFGRQKNLKVNSAENSAEKTQELTIDGSVSEGQTGGGKRDEIIDHISSMPDSEKKKYSYIWMAELNNGEKIVQFDTRGNEISYGKVRTELENENVTGLYWVPIQAGKTGYALKTQDVSSSCGLLKRGYIQHTVGQRGEERGFAYRIGCDGEYLYVSEEGDTVVSSDGDLNVVEEFGMTEE